MLDTKLYTLISLYETKSFTKTAEALALTQPAVSNHIRSLEKEYGFDICTREKKQISFSEKGILLVKYAYEMLHTYDNMHSEIKNKITTNKTIKIGTTRALEADTQIIMRISDYIEQNPGHSFKVITAPINTLYTMLKNYELDFIIIDSNPRLDAGDLVSITLETDHLFCFVSKKNPLSQKPVISIDDLKQFPMVMWTPTSTYRLIFEDALTQIGEHIKNFDILLETDSITSIKTLVDNNVAISIFPQKMGLNRSKYICIPIENLHMKRDINMVYRRDYTNINVIKEFI